MCWINIRFNCKQCIRQFWWICNDHNNTQHLNYNHILFPSHSFAQRLTHYPTVLTNIMHLYFLPPVTYFMDMQPPRSHACAPQIIRPFNILAKEAKYLASFFILPTLSHANHRDVIVLLCTLFMLCFICHVLAISINSFIIILNLLLLLLWILQNKKEYVHNVRVYL